jgi:hypothetical protein
VHATIVHDVPALLHHKFFQKKLKTEQNNLKQMEDK